MQKILRKVRTSHSIAVNFSFFFLFFFSSAIANGRLILLYLFIGERAKRARRYLVMFMETRDIYMYICTSVSNTHARVSVLRIKFKSKETEDFLA